MFLRIIFIVLLFFSFTCYSYSAASSDAGTKSNYDQAAKLIKSAKKYESKGKNKKAKKRYERALKLLVIANKEKPNQPDTLNYLGFATRKLGDFKKGEEYYLLGLKFDPNHKGINEYLGELYVVTNRIDLAKKRYERALKLLIKANKEKPKQPDILNYLGFTTRKLGNYEKGEEYYLLGLQIDPDHKGINEYLGELYVVTNRIDLALKRLDVLKNCNCEEYQVLKEIIEGKKQSKY